MKLSWSISCLNPLLNGAPTQRRRLDGGYGLRSQSPSERGSYSTYSEGEERIGAGLNPLLNGAPTQLRALLQ